MCIFSLIKIESYVKKHCSGQKKTKKKEKESKEKMIEKRQSMLSQESDC